MLEHVLREGLDRDVLVLLRLRQVLSEHAGLEERVPRDLLFELLFQLGLIEAHGIDDR